MRFPILALALFLALCLAAPAHAVTVTYGGYDTFGEATWQDAYATPHRFTEIYGFDYRHGKKRNPTDTEDILIDELDNPHEFTTDSSLISVLALPAGDVTYLPPGAFTARAQTLYGANKVAVSTSRHYNYDSSTDPSYFVHHESAGDAHSRWSDAWTFTGAGSVSLQVGWDAQFDVDSICGSPCSQVSQPDPIDLSYLQGPFWTYRAQFGIYDMDVLQTIYIPEVGTFEIPTAVAAFDVRHDSYQVGGSLDPIAGTEVLTFTPIAGHHYVVGSMIRLGGSYGADVDAMNTMALTQILLGAGMTLESVAAAQYGATYNIEVPEPSAAALLAAALGALALRRGARARA